MIKMIATGLVGVMAALAGSKFGYNLIFSHEAVSEEEPHGASIVQVTTELTGVPIIVGNAVAGYVVLRLSSVVDQSKLPSKDVIAVPFLADAAFRATYAFAENGIPHIQPGDIERLTEEVRILANKKIGAEAVMSTNLDQFNYVEKSEIRGMVLDSKNPPANAD